MASVGRISNFLRKALPKQNFLRTYADAAPSAKLGMSFTFASPSEVKLKKYYNIIFLYGVAIYFEHFQLILRQQVFCSVINFSV